MKLERGARIISILAIISMIISIYMGYLHYSPAPSAFCNFGENLNCDVVNKSEWSEIFGIPVVLLGFLTFLVIFALNSFILKDKKEFSGFDLTKRSLITIQLIILIWSTLYSYGFLLLYVEYYKLGGIYCPLCLVLDILILAMLIVALIIHKEVKNAE